MLGESYAPEHFRTSGALFIQKVQRSAKRPLKSWLWWNQTLRFCA